MITLFKKWSKNLIFRLIAAVFVLIIIFICFSYFDTLLSQKGKEKEKCITLNEDWTISINQEHYTDVALDHFRFPAVNTGDQIEMSCILPDYSSISVPTMRLYTRHSSIEVLIEQAKIFSYGVKQSHNNQTVGGGNTFITLPEHCQNRKLTIKFCVVEDHAFSCFKPIQIYSWKSAHSLLMIENRVPMFLSCFLCIFGIVTLIISLILYMIYRTTHSFFFISLFSIAIGTWGLCFFQVLTLFSVPLYLISNVEYISLYLMPIPLSIYLLPQVKRLDKRIFTYIYQAMELIMIGSSFTVICLHFLNITHLATVLPMMQALIIGYLCIAILLLILNIRKKEKNTQLYLIGLLIVLLFSGYDLISYCLYRYFSLKIEIFNGLTPLGMIVFISITVVDALQQVTQAKMAEAEQNLLRKRAFTDSMTQIYNRSYCTEYMNDASMDQDYVVGCVDINNLKQANDTFGHVAGDRLILATAQILSETFAQDGIVGRMGGDEFIFIIQYIDDTQLNKLLETLCYKMKIANISNPDLNLSIAYGYVISSAYPNCTLEQLYNKADEKMYIKKKNMKEQA